MRCKTYFTLIKNTGFGERPESQLRQCNETFPRNITQLPLYSCYL